MLLQLCEADDEMYDDGENDEEEDDDDMGGGGNVDLYGTRCRRVWSGSCEVCLAAAAKPNTAPVSSDPPRHTHPYSAPTFSH